jgi:orotidine-5'-phosphate decarboxylase
MAAMNAREQLIVALDVESADAGARLAEALHGRAGLFKVGSEVFTAEGPLLARHLIACGHKIFLDLKFHDIPNTVKSAAREAAGMGASIFTVHALGGRAMMQAALEGARDGAAKHGNARPLVVAVTVLTSMSAPDLDELGIHDGPEEAVIRLAKLAQAAGLDGVVASAKEIEAIRRVCGPKFTIITPGIRMPAAATQDQSRVATPGAAIRAGANYLVVGRPITRAPDPVAAAQDFVTEMEKALAAGAALTQRP